MMKVYYLASDPRYIAGLKNYTEKQGLDLIPYHNSKVPEDFEVMLIFSPLRTFSIATLPELIWKKFLSQQNPNIKLIIASFKKTGHPNHIDLLNLPSNFVRFTQRSKTVAEVWIPVELEGLDLQEKLNRFYEGHGQESIIDSLGKILRKIKIINNELKNKTSTYQEVATAILDSNYHTEQWQRFRTRWKSYMSIFTYLPFYDELKLLEERIETISPFFHENGSTESSYINLNCYDNFFYIYDKLERLKKQYING